METRAEKIKKGWRNYYSVSNSSSMTCGDMTCYKCKEKIEGDYLIQDRQNFMLRGNENDERYLFDRKCSSENSAWVKFDREQNDYAQRKIIREGRIKEVKTLIEKYELRVDDLFED